MDQDSGRAELAEVVRPLQEHLRLTRRARAVHEPDGQLLPRAPDGVRSLAKIAQIVQRVVEPEDIDAASGRAGHEPADDVARDRARADEKPTAQRHPERRRAARANRTDAFPWALDPAPHCRVEAPAAGHLETREAGSVELGGQLVEPGRGDPVRERLLGEKPNRRVDELGHSYAREM